MAGDHFLVSLAGWGGIRVSVSVRSLLVRLRLPSDLKIAANSKVLRTSILLLTLLRSALVRARPYAVDSLAQRERTKVKNHLLPSICQ